MSALISLAFIAAGITLGLLLITYFASAAGDFRKLSSILSGLWWAAMGTALILTGHYAGMAVGTVFIAAGVYFSGAAADELREDKPTLRQRLGG